MNDPKAPEGLSPISLLKELQSGALSPSSISSIFLEGLPFNGPHKVAGQLQRLVGRLGLTAPP